MIDGFNLYSSSADCASADLRAARQTRHVAPTDIDAFVDRLFEAAKPRSYIRLDEVFGAFLSEFGCACDCCGTMNPVPADRVRRGADRMLSNLDGLTKLILCKECSNSFDSFCRRRFHRDTRVVYSAELESMMLGFIAWKVKCAAICFLRGERRVA